jgi:hypothetical protein
MKSNHKKKALTVRRLHSCYISGLGRAQGERTCAAGLKRTPRWCFEGASAL